MTTWFHEPTSEAERKSLDRERAKVAAMEDTAERAGQRPVSEPHCAKCGKWAGDIDGYRIMVPGMDRDAAADYAWATEGTLDKETGALLDDECWISVGMPASMEKQWKATPENLAKLGIGGEEFL